MDLWVSQMALQTLGHAVQLGSLPLQPFLSTAELRLHPHKQRLANTCTVGCLCIRICQAFPATVTPG